MYSLVFESLIDSGKIEIKLYSHYTCICGDSGEGKTHFVSTIEDGINSEEIRVYVKDNNGVREDISFVVANAATIGTVIEIDRLQVILIDEVTMLRSKDFKKINTCKHLIIGVSRSSVVKLNYPMQGMYMVTRDDSDDGVIFDLVPVKKLPLLSNKDLLNKKNIITEACNNRSENEFLQVYFNNVKGCGGRDKIAGVLRRYKNKDILVFEDLCAIGGAYQILVKRCKDNKFIRFYPYNSFEELICASSVVYNSLSGFKYGVYDFVSLEQFYEKLLEYATRGNKLIEYKHGKPLPVYLLDCNNLESILNSKVGNLLLQYIKLHKDL